VPEGVSLVELPGGTGGTGGPDDGSGAGAAKEAALTRLLAEERADAVIERYSLASGPARRASARCGIPLVLEVNAPLVLEASRHRGLTDVETWLGRERAIFSSADAVGVVSTALVGYVERQVGGPTPCRWVPNGVDAARFATAPATLGLSRDRVVVGFTGSMKIWHGVADLVDAVASLGSSAPVHLVLAGSGPESSEVERRIRRHGLQSRTLVVGQLAHADVPPLLAALDIGAAPYSPTADFYFSPMKVLEYMAAGLPVVCPAIGDLPATVGAAGLLYRAGDVGALAEALGTLVGDAGRREAASSAAAAIARRWSWDANAAAYEELVAGAMTGAGELTAGLPTGGRR
jgi:glycosyltransferase involved in cell wall biosynthesis